MLPFFLIPILIACIRHKPVRLLSHAWDLYPLFLVELVHLFFQLCCWCGDYRFIPYATALQWAFLLVLLVPILRRRLYVPALFGAGCTIAGSILNRMVIVFNDGVMPVYPTLSELTGYCTRSVLAAGVDQLHVLMTSASRLWFLGDYIDLGWCILSPGDILNHLFISIILYSAISAFPQVTEKKQ